MRYTNIKWLEKIKKEATRKGGICLSDKYINCTTHYSFKCKNNHIFELTANDLKYRWCPYCSKYIHIREEIFRKIFEHIFEKPFPKKRPFWLINEVTGKRMELDGYCAERSLAFEYLGTQHFKKLWYMSAQKFDELQLRDLNKKMLCAKYGITCFYFSGHDDTVFTTKKLSTLVDLVIRTVEDLGIVLPNRNKNIDFSNIGYVYLEELAKVAISKGGKLLSKVYLGTDHKLMFRCARGHTFESTPYLVLRRKHWCSFCGGTHKLTLDDFNKLAEDRGGRCLSVEYINNRTPLRFVCNNDHIWSSRPLSIKNLNSWCPVCARSSRDRDRNGRFI